MALPRFAVVDLETSGFSTRRDRILQIGLVVVDADGKIVSNLVKNEKHSYQATLTDYAEAAEAVAEESNLPFLDLHRISIAHHNQIGPEASMTYNFKEGDLTHFNRKGAEAIAGLIFEELETVLPEMATFVKKAG